MATYQENKVELIARWTSNFKGKETTVEHRTEIDFTVKRFYEMTDEKAKELLLDCASALAESLYESRRG